MSCPWCETTLGIDLDDREPEQSCPECLTSWTYEVAAQPDVALAA